MKTEQNKILVLDGHAFAFKAYYAFINQNLTNSSGMNVSAIYGFFRMFFRMIEMFDPTHVVCTFDTGKKVFRSDIYPEYKKNTRQ